MQGGKRREPAALPGKGRRTRKEAPGEAGAEAGELRPTRGKQRPGGAARSWGRGVALAQRLHRAGAQPSAVLGGCGLSLGPGPALRPRRRRSRRHGTRSARRSLPGARRAAGAEPARPPPPSATTAPPTADSALASPRPFRRADRPLLSGAQELYSHWLSLGRTHQDLGSPRRRLHLPLDAAVLAVAPSFPAKAPPLSRALSSAANGSPWPRRRRRKDAAEVCAVK